LVDLLSRLEQASFPGDHALSLYLAAGPALDRRYHHALLKDLEKAAEPELEPARKPALHRESLIARRYLDQVSPSGKPLAVFSCRSRGLFEALSLPEDVRSQLYIGERLELAPLREILLRHPPALVVLADKQKARVFHLVLAEVQEVAELEGDPVRRHRQGGWSDRRFQRHQDEQAHWNLKAAAEWVDRYGPAERPLRTIYLGGPPEARASFKRLLPKRLQQTVAREFAAPLTISSAELTERIRAAS